MLVLGGLLEEREECHGHEEQLWDVGAVCVGPIVKGGALLIEEILLHLLCCLSLRLLGVSCNSCIVDEYAKTLLLRLNLLDESGNLALGCDVGDNWNDLSGNVLTVRLDDIFKLLFGTADNIDFSSIDCQSLGSHESNTTAASGDQGDLLMSV